MGEGKGTSLMPTYVFRCPDCHKEFSRVLSIADRNVGKCLDCDRIGFRVYVPVPVHFKGPGFYVNDYGKKETPGDSSS